MTYEDLKSNESIDRQGDRLLLTIGSEHSIDMSPEEEAATVELVREMVTKLPGSLRWFFTLLQGAYQLIHESSEEDAI